MRTEAALTGLRRDLLLAGFLGRRPAGLPQALMLRRRLRRLFIACAGYGSGRTPVCSAGRAPSAPPHRSRGLRRIPRRGTTPAARTVRRDPGTRTAAQEGEARRKRATKSGSLRDTGGGRRPTAGVRAMRVYPERSADFTQQAMLALPGLEVLTPAFQSARDPRGRGAYGRSGLLGVGREQPFLR